MTEKILNSSFRDPSGYLFMRDNALYRHVAPRYRDNYDMLMSGGLYDNLVGKGLLIPHVEVEKPVGHEEAYKVIKPEPIDFISYPFEWTFGQLKDAALCTLEIQEISMDHGMTLKDASAFNIQFHRGKPVLIDTLSFEKYVDGTPWVAYGQICRHFLAPLALAAMVDVRMLDLMRIHLDGVPLDLASRLLPFRSRANFGLLNHIHFHARTEKHYSGRKGSIVGKGKVSRLGMLGIIDSLEKTVRKLELLPADTRWGKYYGMTNYSETAMRSKRTIVGEIVGSRSPATVWDLGANDGSFSRIASEKNIFTVSMDSDFAAVEKNYIEMKRNGGKMLLPLRIDLTNLGAGAGWASTERMSLMERGPADMALALGLVHHLAIGNNVPLPRIASFLAGIARSLVIEFVPKDDSQVLEMLAFREDVFDDYDIGDFEKSFSAYFEIVDKRPVEDSKRVIYHYDRWA